MVPLLQHYLNPVHVYCRLREIKLPKRQAILFCRLYEKVVFRPLLADKEYLKDTYTSATSAEAANKGDQLK